MKNTAVFGIYRDRNRTENAVDKLIAAGFRTGDLSVLLPEHVGTKDFAGKRTKAPEGTATGAAAGGAVGGTLGLLAGIGALSVPGMGPLVAAGPLMSALAGAGAGGLAGGIVAALAGLGLPERDAKRYEGRIKQGGILMSVRCDNADWVKRAKEVLQQTGAEDVSATGEAGADSAKTGKPLPKTRTSGGY